MTVELRCLGEAVCHQWNPKPTFNREHVDLESHAARGSSNDAVCVGSDAHWISQLPFWPCRAKSSICSKVTSRLARMARYAGVGPRRATWGPDAEENVNHSPTLGQHWHEGFADSHAANQVCVHTISMGRAGVVDYTVQVAFLRLRGS